MNMNKINGYGAILRFITPILVTIMLFYLSGIREDIKQTKTDMKAGFEKSEVYFNNHLSSHKLFDKEIYERLSRIEERVK